VVSTLFFEWSCVHVFVFFCGAYICEGKLESLVQDLGRGMCPYFCFSRIFIERDLAFPLLAVVPCQGCFKSCLRSAFGTDAIPRLFCDYRSRLLSAFDTDATPRLLCDYRSRLLSAFGTDAMPRVFMFYLATRSCVHGCS